MTYLYNCTKCDKTSTVKKPSSECSTEEKCSECGEVLVRVYTSPGISTGDGRKM